MSATASVSGTRQAGACAEAASSERDRPLERLHNLRTILPVMAAELASARRQAAQLLVENRRLKEQLRRAHGDGRDARASATVHRRLAAKLAREGRAGAPYRP